MNNKKRVVIVEDIAISSPLGLQLLSCIFGDYNINNMNISKQEKSLVRYCDAVSAGATGIERKRREGKEHLSQNSSKTPVNHFTECVPATILMMTIWDGCKNHRHALEHNLPSSMLHFNYEWLPAHSTADLLDGITVVQSAKSTRSVSPSEISTFLGRISPNACCGILFDELEMELLWLLNCRNELTHSSRISLQLKQKAYFKSIILLQLADFKPITI